VAIVFGSGTVCLMAKRLRKKKPSLAEETEALAADPQDRREAAAVRDLMGSVRFLVSDEELIEPLYEDWEPDPIK
jgi:hypothetical protein